MSHQEKQRIFDEYAKSQGFEDFLDSMYEYWSKDNSLSNLISHIFAACDLVQEEQQKRIYETTEVDRLFSNNKSIKSSILNPENKIQ